MVDFANAKINIGLHITERRKDGFHNLETIFYPIQVYDVLEIVPSSEVSLTVYNAELPGDIADNLCVKAYNLLAQDFSLPALDIHLLKNIPVGAGLGGGSSDASHILKMINTLLDLQIDITNLEKYAAGLGADCPFFIQNTPTYATGIGHDFQPLELDLSDFNIVVIKPDVFVSTADAYRSVVPKAAAVDLREVVRLPIQDWKNYIFNDFESGIFKKYPAIEAVKNAMYKQDALYASMSGSGSSVYGIFEKSTSIDGLEKYGRVLPPVIL